MPHGNGGWIPGKSSRIGEYSRFQGLQFKSTSHNAFAWPLLFYTDSIPVHRAPGYNTPLTDDILYPYIDDVDLAEQILAVYDNHQLVFATVIASELEPFRTCPGLFQIYQKKETETMRNNDPTNYYYLDNVPWTMYFDKARALHGAYWRIRFGYPQSHGCVNLSVGDAHWLFNWAHEGDFVYVHDPALYHDWAY